MPPAREHDRNAWGVVNGPAALIPVAWYSHHAPGTQIGGTQFKPLNGKGMAVRDVALSATT